MIKFWGSSKSSPEAHASMQREQAEERVAYLLFSPSEARPADLTALKMMEKLYQDRKHLLEQNADASGVRGATDNSALSSYAEQIEKIKNIIRALEGNRNN